MEQRRKAQNDKPKLIKRISKEKKINHPNNTGVKNNKKISSNIKTNKVPLDSVRKRKNKENINKKIEYKKIKKNNIINKKNNNNKKIKKK